MEEIICYCKQVSKKEIEIAILKGAITLKDVQDVTGACTGNQCKEMNPSGRCCSTEIKEMLKDNTANRPDSCSCCS